MKTRITVTVDRDIFEMIRGFSWRYGVAVSELVEKLFSEVANKAEIIEDQVSVAVVLRDSAISVRKRNRG
ncbi:MAG: ribbon-helix-helix domain-containing protein [Infirmifilum sp.]